MSAESPVLPVPLELVELIAERAAELVADRLADSAPTWLNVAQAAEYLACPKTRIYDLVSQRRIQFSKEGSRTLFRREWLDEVVTGGPRA